MPEPLVSVVIAARNAGQTLAEALASVQEQTYPCWEVIVVDDGSTDDTANVAHVFAAAGNRCQTIHTPGVGVSAARNAGLMAAEGEWLLFLDADDWIKPNHLETLLRVLGSDPTLDAAYCGWERVAGDGRVYHTENPTQAGDLFPALALRCVFAIHSCVVRRRAVLAVHGFDPDLSVGEDWDLWQRLARSGVRFGVVPEALARYRTNPGTASADGLRLLHAALRVVAQGHAPDERVAHPVPAHAAGMPSQQLPRALYAQAIWSAGFLIGQGRATGPVLDAVRDAEGAALYPEEVADLLFHAVAFARFQPASAWGTVWDLASEPVARFLAVLEAQTEIDGLARAAQRSLERTVLRHAPHVVDMSVGTMYGAERDVVEPLADVPVPAGHERLYVRIAYGGKPVGAVELPVCAPAVSAFVLADAIAARFAWEVLGQFLTGTVYPLLSLHDEVDGVAVWRGDVRLATSLPAEVEGNPHMLHDYVGWTVFLQELFGQPTWDAAAAYDPSRPGDEMPDVMVWDGITPLRVELSDPLPAVHVTASHVPIIPLVGGSPLGVVWVEAAQDKVNAAALRVALLTALGYELCVACVRAGLIGQAGDSGASLRERIRMSAACGKPVVDGLGRRMPTLFGTSASRRVQFPAEAAADVQAVAGLAGEHLTRRDAVWNDCYYVPEHLGRLEDDEPRSPAVPPETHAEATRLYGRRHFEGLFARAADPWKYTSPYEQTKYEQTLALLPERRFRNALELACAEGHFTMQLAPHTERLVAADISELALQRTAQRCKAFDHLTYHQLDLASDPIPGQFDLVVCSEVLYYMGDREALRGVAERIYGALASGGYLVMAHAHTVADSPDAPGFDWDVPYGAATIGEVFTALPGLDLVRELRTPLYRIQLFRRRPRFAWRTPAVERTVLDRQPTSLEPHIAAHVLWQGGAPARGEQVTETARLPILMYHRVAPSGSERMRRYRVSPEGFETQLRYLRDAGYYGISLEDWGRALASRRPLPGNAVLLTFDDGYAGFDEYAWPLLKQYGFPATVFLVTDAVGKTNAWDRRYGETVSLMDWPEIQRLHAEGVSFGAHSCTHPFMTSLTPAQIVAEGVRARTTLEARLGTPVHAFCYPYGLHDPVVEHLIGGCGYLYGLGVHRSLSTLKDDRLALPRLEVTGHDRLEDFIAILA